MKWTKNGVDYSTNAAIDPQPLYVDGDAYVAVFAENDDVTINYVAETGGSVSCASETLAPATGEAQGSVATAAAGYHFVNWTNAAGDVVSEEATFVPAKVGGLNVAATYTAHFEKNDYTLTIEYRYESIEGQQAAPIHQETLKYQDSYNVESPAIKGYVADNLVVKGTMPAQNVHVVVIYTTGITPYAVNYYYQNREGEYQLFANRMASTTTGALVYLTDDDKTPQTNKPDNTTPGVYVYNSSAAGLVNGNGDYVQTIERATVAADGSTVLNAFFDQKFKVIFKYYEEGESLETAQTVKETDYIYGLYNTILFPEFDDSMESDKVWTTADGTVWNADNTVLSQVDYFGEYDGEYNVLVLYTTAKVKPLATGDLVVRKDVTGNLAPAGQAYNFTLEVKVTLPDKTLTAEEAKELQGYNADVIFAEKALGNAKDELDDAKDMFAGHAKATTVSTYDFIITDDNDVALFGVTTGSVYMFRMSNSTGSVYEFDAYDAFKVDGEPLSTGLLNEIFDFFKALANDEIEMPEAEALLKLMEGNIANTSGSAISFQMSDAYQLFAAIKDEAAKQEAADAANAARDAFLKESGMSKWITINGEKYDLFKGEDGFYTTTKLLDFQLKDGESMGFTFEVTSGSAISYVVTEVNDANLASVHEHAITVNADGSQTWGEGVLLAGKVAIGEVTTGSATGFTFTNAYGDKTPGGGYDPYDPWTPQPPKDPEDPDDPNPPEIVIDDPEVPTTEPDIPEEPVVVPGEEIEEPEIPLGDAPKTGDTTNAVPFMALMMFALCGLVITRRKFN